MTSDEKNTSRADAVIDSLLKLDELRGSGAVTEEEFLRLKAGLIGQSFSETGQGTQSFGGDISRRQNSAHSADDRNIRRYADTLFGSFVSELKTSDTKKSGIKKGNSYDFKMPSPKNYTGEISSQVSRVSVQSLLADIDFSLDNIPARPAPKKQSALAAVPEKRPPAPRCDEPVSEDLTAGIDFSLDDTFGNAPPVTADMTADIDFSLDGLTPIIQPPNQNKAPAPVIGNAPPANYIDRLTEKFMPMHELYEKRNEALMNAERLEKLSLIPIFAVGVAAAVFFFIVLEMLAGLPGTVENFLLLLCFWGGVAPACIIIPNSLKCSRETKKAAKADSELREYYESSGYTDIPYELTDPYILEYLAETAEGNGINGIRKAAAMLGALNAESLEKIKKQADTSADDETAARSASVYVLGKRMTSERIVYK